MNKPGKTLIILTPAFAADENDSYLPAQESFIRTLNKDYPSLDIIVLTFHFPVTKTYSYTWFGNKVFAFSGNMKGNLNSLLLWKRVWQQLSILNKENNIIGIFSFFCSESAFVGHYFAKRHRLKHHIWVLGQDAKKSNKQVRRIRPLADELVTISDFLVREFEQNHGIKPKHVIPIGINAGDFPENKYNRTIDFIGAGSLSALKQYNLFVDVVAMVKESIPDVNAMICGNGPEEHRLREQMERLNVIEHITMTGLKRDRADVLELLFQSKILLHTSSYEGFGMICTEALFAGAYVISFIKPMDATIAHWHVVEDEADMAAKAIALLMDNQIRHESVMPFNMHDTAANIMKLFNYEEA